MEGQYEVKLDLPGGQKEDLRCIDIRTIDPGLQLPPKICIMTDGPDSSMLKLKALGRAIAPGELYDSRTSQFLGVQLCPADVIASTTKTSRTPQFKCDIHQSKSIQSKAQVLDVGAEVSAEILSGLVSVSGAASYLNNSKSNSEDYAWGLSLSCDVETTRFSYLDRRVGESITRTDIIKHYGNRATHVVTEVVYGGTMIFNLVVNEQTKEEEQGIEGMLEVKLKKLPGAISAEGKVDVKVKEELSSADKQLDIVINADAALDRVPVDLESVFETLPDAIAKVNLEPVPVSVVLHAIPVEDFEHSGFIRELNDAILGSIVDVFNQLRDIQNRFATLQQSVAKYNDIVPALVDTVNAETLPFQAESASLLKRLAAYLRAYKSDEPTEDIGELLNEAQRVIDDQLQTPIPSPTYPKHLTGLESAYRAFAKIVFYLKPTLYLTSLLGLREEVISIASAAVVVIPKLPRKPTYKQYSEIVTLARDASAYYASQQPPVNVYILYAEDPDTLDATMHGGGQFKQLQSATGFLGQKKMGKISWTQVDRDQLVKARDLLYDASLNQITDYVTNDTFRRCYYSTHGDGLDATTSYTFVIKARYTKDETYTSNGFSPFISFELGDNEFILGHNRTSALVDYIDVILADQGQFFVKGPHVKELQDGKNFHCAFVQDIDRRKWMLYFNGEKVGDMDIPLGGYQSSPINVYSSPVQSQKSPISPDHQMRGALWEMRGYDKALSQLQIAFDAGSVSNSK